jgi:SagB-type dehydrogenase family enzyme
MLHAELEDAPDAADRGHRDYPGAELQLGADVTSSPGEITCYDDVATDYVFAPDLLVEGRRERLTTSAADPIVPLSDDARPMLVPGTRQWADDQGRIHFALPPGEPNVEHDRDCTVLRRTRREVVICGLTSIVGSLVALMDGTATVTTIRAGLPARQRDAAGRLISLLAAAGVVDLSGRAVGRFIHTTTKKGVLPAGGLEGDDVLRLATDGAYREYPGSRRIAIGPSIPKRLHAFHELTRARRSPRDFGDHGLPRAEFDALLLAACGVTAGLSWGGREVKLRAYPSSGALYAVEIYPVALRIEGLEVAVYHFLAAENALEAVNRIDRDAFVAAALPADREMVASAAAMICLTGIFPRHEQKYGEGGYRMLVAEAGHISQNLILAATALGVSARPFGGVFDDVLNDRLGLDRSEEQFLLAVLVGGGPSRLT